MAHETSNPQTLGVDVSLVGHLEAMGAVYLHQGRRVDPLELLRENGLSTARLRLFHTPSGRGAQVNDLSYTIGLARRCVRAGYKILLCMHYSDTWADPGKQFMPAAWRDLDDEALEIAIETYTESVLGCMAEAGCTPECVQIGNEITGGFLWDRGRVVNTAAGSTGTSSNDWAHALDHDSGKWERFTNLLKAATRGARRGADRPIKTMLHIDRGGDGRSGEVFFAWMDRFGVEYDQIGLSYYPFWHGTLDDLARTVAHLSATFDKPVHVVETAFPHAADPVYVPDSASETEALGMPTTSPVDYDLTPEGQRLYVRDLLTAMAAHRDRGWEGLSYWAPEWIEVADHKDERDARPCWVRALFDSNGEALPALNEFGRFASDLARSQVSVRTVKTAVGVRSPD